MVIGFVETHGRTETEALIDGLEVVPRRRSSTAASTVEEMSLNNILKRKPAVAMVDELAHTNVPGSRNRKRYQDVLELLDAGINVIGAFNVQHLESLNDIVERATGVAVRETMPDSFLKQADQVVNLDLAVEDLQERLRAGKIYARRQDPVGAGALLQGAEPRAPARAGAARGGRERRARQRRHAPRAATSRGRRRRRRAAGSWSACPRLAARRRAAAQGLAAGRAPQHRLVRRLRRDAAGDARPDRRRGAAPPARQHRAGPRAGRRGGAPARARPGRRRILEFARSHGVGHIVVGRSHQPWWKQLLGRIDPVRLVREGGGFDLHVVAARERGAARRDAAGPSCCWPRRRWRSRWCWWASSPAVTDARWGAVAA